MLLVIAIATTVTWTFAMRQRATTFKRLEKWHLYEEERHVHEKERHELLLKVLELQLDNETGSFERLESDVTSAGLNGMSPEAIEQLRREISYHGRYQQGLENSTTNHPLAPSVKIDIDQLRQEIAYYAGSAEYHRRMAHKYRYGATKPWLFAKPPPIPPEDL